MHIALPLAPSDGREKLDMKLNEIHNLAFDWDSDRIQI